jgi:hypothetical protein
VVGFLSPNYWPEAFFQLPVNLFRLRTSFDKYGSYGRRYLKKFAYESLLLCDSEVRRRDRMVVLRMAKADKQLFYFTGKFFIFATVVYIFGA